MLDSIRENEHEFKFYKAIVDSMLKKDEVL